MAALLLFRAPSRLHAYTTLFAYYLGAGWPVVPGATAFFGSRANPAEGFLLWLGSATFLATPALLLFARNRKKRPLAIVGMFLVTALPPLGIIGWASPFLSAGVLFPGTRWLGLITVLGILAFLGRFPLCTVALVSALAIVANALYTPPALPTGWQAISTEFGGAGQSDPDFLAEFNAHEHVQEIIARSDAQVLIFPEHIVTQWNEATETFWHRSLERLVARKSTVLIGAGLPIPGMSQFLARGRYYNALIAKGQDSAVYFQRIPVPLGMWKPFRDDGVPLNLLGPGTIPIQKQRAAVLICYEQLLVWPFVSSALEHPTVVVTAANDYWAKQTVIPKIQQASAASWARLFDLPLLSAVNL